MKTASAGLIALLDNQQFLMADLYTFTLADGTILRYTSADGDLVVSGNTYYSTGPQMSRGNTKNQIGVEVDTLNIHIMTNISVQYNGQSLAAFAQLGGFDGARLSLERTFMPVGSWGDTSAGTLKMFSGRVADVIVCRTSVDIAVNSDLELLNIMLPKNMYQGGCIHTLYDSGCALNRSSFQSSTSVASGSTASVLNCSLTQADGYFDLGYVVFTSGSSSGLKRTIKSYTAGQIVLSTPVYVTPSIGDTFDTYPGCDKLQSTCTNKFNNLVNFRGYPYIPAPEVAH